MAIRACTLPTPYTKIYYNHTTTHPTHIPFPTFSISVFIPFLLCLFVPYLFCFGSVNIINTFTRTDCVRSDHMKQKG